MKRILNLPNSEKINNTAIEQIYKNNFPEYVVYSKSNYIYVKKNLFVTLRSYIGHKGDSCNRLFYGTKMSFLLLAGIILPIVIALICMILMKTDSMLNPVFLEDFNNAYRKSQLYVMVEGICLIVSFIIYVTYLIMRGTLLKDVHLVLYKELPVYCEEKQRFYFFPRLEDVRKWKSLMGIVKGLAFLKVTILVIKMVLPYILGFLKMQISWETMYSYVYPALSGIDALAVLVIAIIFLMKSYNNNFTIAKYAFFCYAIFGVILLVLYSLHIPEDLKVISYISKYVTIMLAVVFVIYLYKAFCNGATLYLLKNYIIYAFLLVLLDILLICSSDMQSIAMMIFQVLSIVCGIYYAIIIVKSMTGLYEQVPQGIKIKY